MPILYSNITEVYIVLKSQFKALEDILGNYREVTELMSSKANVSFTEALLLVKEKNKLSFYVNLSEIFLRKFADVTNSLNQKWSNTDDAKNMDDATKNSFYEKGELPEPAPDFNLSESPLLDINLLKQLINSTENLYSFLYELMSHHYIPMIVDEEKINQFMVDLKINLAKFSPTHQSDQKNEVAQSASSIKSPSSRFFQNQSQFDQLTPKERAKQSTIDLN